MKTVGVRELRQDASRLIDHIDATGESIIITNHGRPVAQLSPIPGSQALTLAQLVAASLARPARGHLLDVEPVQLPPGSPSSAELLLADRDDRL